MCKHDFCGKSRYDRVFQKVTHKGGEYAINYVEIFQNSQALSVILLNNYLEDQLIHTFLDNFHHGGKYSSQIDSHQVALSREVKFTDKTYLFISIVPARTI